MMQASDQDLLLNQDRVASFSCQDSRVWIPQTKNELIGGLPDVSETAELEFKQQLPAAGKNEEIAIDVAAMTTDGGTIIYGVAEDKSLGTFIAAPIPLPGAMERISNVVNSSIAGSPSVDIFSLDPDQATPSDYQWQRPPVTSPTAT